jgi:hypothetical protein
MREPNNNSNRRLSIPMETIEVELEPELISFIEAFAAELGMEPDKFAGMVVTQHIAPQN